jgi:hypothetical protein
MVYSFWTRQQHCSTAFPFNVWSRIMKRPSLSLLAAIALVSPIAALPVSATAGQDRSVASATNPVLTETAGEALATPEALRSDHLFEQDELAELAALEAENVELQQQEAGFFGPRIGTIIVIAIVLILLL